ncbi:MAG: signal peptidase I [Oscillospiraceae bacterium]|nr:signal peptidase I [Oscillospiraceae bacterium]
MPSGASKEIARFDIRRELYEWAQALITALIAFALLYTFAARVIGVDGISMSPTLQNHEKLLISKLFYKPARGDIIMFTKKDAILPGEYNSSKPQPLVKRVIGLPGDVIDIDFTAHKVYVNNQALDEPYINEPTALRDDISFPITVPDGCLFVMGDNRNRSIDSRSTRVGMIDERCVLGRVLLRVYPFGKFGPVR